LIVVVEVENGADTAMMTTMMMMITMIQRL